MEENQTQQAEQSEENKYETWMPHPESMHYLWSACRYVKDNPGCSKGELRHHLEGVYPHGQLGKFTWVFETLSTGRKEKDGTWFAGTLALAGFLMYNPVSGKGKGNRRGLYILPRGEALASDPEPPHKFAKPKSMPTAWLEDNCQIGMLMVPRSRTASVMLYAVVDGQKGWYPAVGHLRPGEIVTLAEVKDRISSNDEHSLRKYGRPYANARITILHPTAGLCTVHAECIKPLDSNKKKGGKHVNQ